MIRDLFTRLHALPAAERRWSVQVTAYEIYREAIRDLLASESPTGEYRIREDLTGTRGIYVENVIVREVHTVEEAMDLLAQAAQVQTHSPRGIFWPTVA